MTTSVNTENKPIVDFVYALHFLHLFLKFRDHGVITDDFVRRDPKKNSTSVPDSCNFLVASYSEATFSNGIYAHAT